MNVFDVLMAATGAIALLVYLCIAVSQLNMRRKLEASGTQVQLKMWLFPWLTYAVIFVIVASLITMVVEGTFFNEVVYTSIFGGLLVVLGFMAQKNNWGGEQRAQAEKERLEIQAQLQKNNEA
jgi:GABA permease